MKIRIEYCAVWNYEPQAVGLAAHLLENLKQKIKVLELVPSGGGCFEVARDGKLVYSKLATGAFPDKKDVLKLLR